MPVWRPSGVASAAILLVLMAALLRCEARPCPHTAVFMFSLTHDGDFCVCDDGMACEGPLCSHGVDIHTRNLTRPSSIMARVPAHFAARRQGFPVACTECTCKPKATTTTASSPAQAQAQAQAQNELVHAKPALFRSKEGKIGADYADPLFHATCNVASTKLDGIPHPVALRNATWLHFPKCGTSFTSVLYNYICQSTPWSHRYSFAGYANDPRWASYAHNTCSFCHQPCRSVDSCVGFSVWAPHDGLIHRVPPASDNPFAIAAIGSNVLAEKTCVADLVGTVLTHMPVRNYIHQHKVNILTMFRNPLTRLKSAYNHARHAFGLANRKAITLESKQWSLKQWVAHPGIAGCQTKMLIGRLCSNSEALTSAHLETAKAVVRNRVAFIGLMEAWNQSVCLFHRQFGGSIHPHELENLRPSDASHYEAQGFRIATDEDLHTLTPEDDPIDWELYQYARKIFIERLDLYGLAVPETLRNPTDFYH